MNPLFTNTQLIIALLTLLNPVIIGLIYLNYKPRATLKESIRDGITTCIGSTLIMLVIIRVGTSILDALGVNLLAIRIAGGIILTLSVYQMMNEQNAEASPDLDLQTRHKSVITPFVTPICVGGASISMLFSTISNIPQFSMAAFWNLGSAVFFTFLIIGAFMPISILLFKRIPKSILDAIKTISLFIVFSIGITILLSTIPDIAKLFAPA